MLVLLISQKPLSFKIFLYQRTLVKGHADAIVLVRFLCGEDETMAKHHKSFRVVSQCTVPLPLGMDRDVKV